MSRATRRFFRSARGKVSNRGELPKYVGLFPCRKVVTAGVLPFGSISELRVAEYLAWAPDVVSIAYEPYQKLTFDALDELSPVEFCPDFEIVFDSGEVEWVEAKYSQAGLSTREREKLDLIAAQCERRHHRYRVVYREDLERNGFIDTVSLLRRYADLHFHDDVKLRALDRLQDDAPAHLEDWARHANAKGVAIDLLYHLLYHQHLPLLFQPMIHTELLLCRS